jgi:hypothetical protein
LAAGFFEAVVILAAVAFFAAGFFVVVAIDITSFTNYNERIDELIIA